MRDADRTAAARQVVAWLVEGRAMVGFADPYPDAQWMPQMAQFVVDCDFVPADTLLSDDPRVQRVAPGAPIRSGGERWPAGTDFVYLKSRTDQTGEFVVELVNSFGMLAGHGYEFRFRRTAGGLRVRGQMLWVS
jgi:hypothetical protein